MQFGISGFPTQTAGLRDVRDVKRSRSRINWGCFRNSFAVLALLECFVVALYLNVGSNVHVCKNQPVVIFPEMISSGPSFYYNCFSFVDSLKDTSSIGLPNLMSFLKSFHTYMHTYSQIGRQTDRAYYVLAASPLL